MTRRRHPAVKPQRICAWCLKPIAEQRPVVLTSPVGGHLVGPFHAGCAERIVLQSKQTHEMPDCPGATNYGTWPSRREETLPW